MREALLLYFTEGKKDPLKSSHLLRMAQLVKGSKCLHLPWSRLAAWPHPCYAWASRNWFALSAVPTRKSRGLVSSSRDSEQKSKERNCKVHPGSLSSLQCKQHHRLALQIPWGMKEHSSTWRALIHIWVITAGSLLTIHWPKQLLSQKLLLTHFCFVFKSTENHFLG